VPSALGTDTAGSGRVPAGFNGLVGLKPTPGRVSTTGVLPACRSLDCVSIFAHSVDDAATCWRCWKAPTPTTPTATSQPGPATLPATRCAWACRRTVDLDATIGYDAAWKLALQRLRD
jgi:allophanate hydrolase